MDVASLQDLIQWARSGTAVSEGLCGLQPYRHRFQPLAGMKVEELNWFSWFFAVAGKYKQVLQYAGISEQEGEKEPQISWTFPAFPYVFLQSNMVVFILRYWDTFFSCQMKLKHKTQGQASRPKLSHLLHDQILCDEG